MLDGEFETEAAPPVNTFRSPALDGAIGTRWVNLLMAVQTHWIAAHAEDPQHSRFCRICAVYQRDWWD